MKLIASIQFIGKFFLAAMVLITLKFLSRTVHRGFTCGDPALSLQRHPDTVTNVMLVIWGTSPVLIIMIAETVFNFDSFDKFKQCLKKSWKNTAYLIHRYLVDMLLMHIICHAVKYFTAAPRPHFFETCKPDAMANCTLGTYVGDYTCTNTDVTWISRMDASMSFFSGHASTCFYSCFFICWYLQKRVKTESLFMVPFLQATLICFAYFGSISRVFDHRHHWWDVLTGSIAGVLTTYHACKILCRNCVSEPEPYKLPIDANKTFLPTDNRTQSME